MLRRCHVEAAGAPWVGAHAQNRERFACTASVRSSVTLCCWRRHTHCQRLTAGEVRWWWRRAVKQTSALKSRVLELEDAVHEAEVAFEELQQDKQRTLQQVSVTLLVERWW
jgi:hypothetical protein